MVGSECGKRLGEEAAEADRLDALRQTGELVGYPAKAEGYATEYLDAIKAIDAQKKGNSPRVLALMFRGGKVMAFSGDNMVPGLAARAGAVDAAVFREFLEDFTVECIQRPICRRYFGQITLQS